MEKYMKGCWSCGSHNLEPDDRGVRCRDCGATWNKLPDSGVDPLADRGYYVEDPATGVRVHARQARPIRKARKQSQAPSDKA